MSATVPLCPCCQNGWPCTSLLLTTWCHTLHVEWFLCPQLNPLVFLWSPTYVLPECKQYFICSVTVSFVAKTFALCAIEALNTTFRLKQKQWTQPNDNIQKELCSVFAHRIWHPPSPDADSQVSSERTECPKHRMCFLKSHQRVRHCSQLLTHMSIYVEESIRCWPQRQSHSLLCWGGCHISEGCTSVGRGHVCPWERGGHDFGAWFCLKEEGSQNTKLLSSLKLHDVKIHSQIALRIFSGIV